MPDTGSFTTALGVLYRLYEIAVIPRQAWEGIKHSNPNFGSGQAHVSRSRPARLPHANDHNNLLHFPPIRAQSLLTASSQDWPHSQTCIDHTPIMYISQLTYTQTSISISLQVPLLFSYLFVSVSIELHPRSTLRDNPGGWGWEQTFHGFLVSQELQKQPELETSYQRGTICPAVICLVVTWKELKVNQARLSLGKWQPTGKSSTTLTCNKNGYIGFKEAERVRFT